jgi:hypothetical protein
MASKWLQTADVSEVSACNVVPYGYPSKGQPLPGGIVEPSLGVGWTLERFPVELADPSGEYVVEVDEVKVPAAAKVKLKSSKPKVKNNAPIQ